MHRHSTRPYFLVYATLMALTYVTVQAALFDLGPWNSILALTVAVAKALLVALFFMHLRDSSRLTWLIVGGGLMWLGLLLSTVGDYLTRGLLGSPPKF